MRAKGAGGGGGRGSESPDSGREDVVRTGRIPIQIRCFHGPTVIFFLVLISMSLDFHDCHSTSLVFLLGN